jgi:hypothetical protein
MRAQPRGSRAGAPRQRSCCGRVAGRPNPRRPPLDSTLCAATGAGPGQAAPTTAGGSQAQQAPTCATARAGPASSARGTCSAAPGRSRPPAAPAAQRGRSPCKTAGEGGARAREGRGCVSLAAPRRLCARLRRVGGAQLPFTTSDGVRTGVRNARRRPVASGGRSARRFRAARTRQRAAGPRSHVAGHWGVPSDPWSAERPVRPVPLLGEAVSCPAGRPL